MTAREVIRTLGLQRLPGEGGYFRRTWTSPVRIEGRACGSAIYFLLAEGQDGFSAFHRLSTDEVYHFYCGDPAELHLLRPDGSHERIVLGDDLESGNVPQAIVPAGVIQGSRLVPGGQYALLGTTMAPEFRPKDFTLAPRAELLASYPEIAEIIQALTRE